MPSVNWNLTVTISDYRSDLANGARAATGHYGYQRVTLRVYEPHETVELATPKASDAASLYAVARCKSLTLDTDCI